MKSRLVSVVCALALAISAFGLPTGALADESAVPAVQTALTASASSTSDAAANISNAKVKISSQVYTGKAIKPAVKVTLKSKTLKSGKDYKVKFSNNVKPGKATATITGIGKYIGKAKATFTIKTKKGVMRVGSKAYYFKNNTGKKATGWIKTGSKSYWANKSGLLAAGWKKLSGKWYYFDKSNYAMKTDWQKIGGKYYYFNSKGVMAADQWVGDYYLKSDGTMATSQWVGNYWVNASGKWTDTWTGGSSGSTVYITKSGSKFHADGCSSLRSSKIAISRSDAIARGYTACKNCNP